MVKHDGQSKTIVKPLEIRMMRQTACTLASMPKGESQKKKKKIKLESFFKKEQNNSLVPTNVRHVCSSRHIEYITIQFN